MKLFTEDFLFECRKGNEKARKQLFKELYNPMFRVCFRYAGQHADAEDCMMKGFMKMFQNIDQFKYESEQGFFYWVRRIMVNECLMFIRKKHSFVLSIEEQSQDVSIQAEVVSQMDAEELNSLILSLPTGYRTVFNLFVVEGYDHREISGMLGISESTSRTQLAKARTRLKNLLQEKNYQHEKLYR